MPAKYIQEVFYAELRGHKAGEGITSAFLQLFYNWVKREMNGNGHRDADKGQKGR